MANHSLKLSAFGKVSLKRLEKLAAKWRAEKLTPSPDRRIAHELRDARALYRDKYRPALPPDSGVTLT